MRVSPLRLLRSSMVYSAPSHTAPDAGALKRLTEQKSWRVERVSRNPDDFKDCCGGNATDTSDGNTEKNVSELLKKDFKFRNFREAWGFMSQIADKAESIKHHPEWSNVYNKVSIALTTHSAHSTITSLDLELAEACNAAEDDVVSKRPPKKQKAEVAQE